MAALTSTEPRSAMVLEPLPELLRRFIHTADWAGVSVPETMRINVTENDKEYVVKAEMPGARKEDIHVTVDGNYVSICAELREEKKESKKGNGERMLVHEMRYGTMSRAFSLPREIDQKGVEAKFQNGILALTLPKRGPASGRNIEIK